MRQLIFVTSYSCNIVTEKLPQVKFTLKLLLCEEWDLIKLIKS